MKTKDIAIVGMACRYPGARNYNEYWENLKNGLCSVKEIPAERLDSRKYYSPDKNEPNKCVSKWCGLIDDVDRFDNRFFKISDREAESMAPHHRILLEETWHCIEDSGIAMDRLRERRTSVFLGSVAVFDYRKEAFVKNSTIDSYDLFGNIEIAAANRISHIFGFKGHSISMDSACASSLMSVHEAKNSLIAGLSDYAVAAGAWLVLDSWLYITCSKAGIVSPDGKCKTFDKDANGFALGEGIGVILLQRLEDAIRHGNHVHAIIKGSATSHTGWGKTTGGGKAISAPSAKAQQEMILQAYQEACFSPETVSYVEAHGTGTYLGDPIEIEGLTRAFRKHTDKRQFCKIGSVKTNIGHLVSSSGIAGVIKVALMMRHRKIPPSLHVNTLNPLIDFEQSPFCVATSLADWQTGQVNSVLRAGVTSMGVTGTNAHMLMESHTPERADGAVVPDTSEKLFVLSGECASDVARLIDKWKVFIQDNSCENHLSNICATLLTGREHLRLRCGAFIRDIEDLSSFLANPIVIQKSDRTWGLRVGRITGRSISSQSAFFNCDPFKQKIDHVRTLFDEFGIVENDAHFDRAKSFAYTYAYVSGLMEIGFTPDMIMAERSGIWVGLALAGIVQPRDVLAVLCSLVTPDQIALHRPIIAFYNPVGQNFIQPYFFDAAYVHALIDGLTVSSDALEKYIRKARGLLSGHDRFKRYLKEWDEIYLSFSGRGIEQAIWREGRFEDSERLLLAVIIACALRKLYKKWDLSEPRFTDDAGFCELLCLVEKGGISMKMCAKMIRGEISDYETVADCLNRNQYFLKDGPFPKTNSQRLVEINDVSQWIQSAEFDAPMPETENTNFLDIGSFRHPFSGDQTVHIGTGELSKKTLKNTMLRLWLAGVDIQWDRLYAEGGFQKTPLPVYPFGGGRLWVQAGDIQQQNHSGSPHEKHPPGLGSVKRTEHLHSTLEISYLPADASGPQKTGSSFSVNSTTLSLEMIIQRIRHHLGGLLKIPETALDNDLPLIEQGFESLKAVELGAMVENDFGLKIALAELFDEESIYKISKFIECKIKQAEEKQQTSGEKELEIELSNSDPFSPFPLTDVQQAYWIGRQDAFELGGVATHLYQEYESDSIDLAGLETAINRMIARHPMLRCVVLPDGRQQIQQNVQRYRIDTVDLRGMDPDMAHKELEMLRQSMEKAVLPTDIYPLLQIKAILLDRNKIRLQFYIDILIMDGGSLVIFFHELGKFYHDPDIRLPKLEYTFRDHVVSEPTRQATKSYQNSLAYWEEKIKDLPPGPELSLTKEISSLRGGYRTARVQQTLEKEDWDKIKKKASMVGISPTGVLLGAFADILGLWNKALKFSINMTVFNRPAKHRQINDIIGDFTNLMFVSADYSMKVSFESRVKDMQRQIWNNMDHIQVGFLRVQREFKRMHAITNQAAFPVVFTSLINPYQEELSQKMEWLGQEVYSISQTPQVLIDHIVQEKNGALFFCWDYVESVFPEDYIESMFEAYVRRIKSLVDDLEWDKVETEPFLCPKQMEKRVRVNATEGHLPTTMLHTLFEKMASSRPDHIAIRTKDLCICYGELEKQGNKVANFLRNQGVKTGDIVAIVMDKGWEQVAAAIGIMKAGAAYLPIDPFLPKDRILLLLEKAEAIGAITQDWLDDQVCWPDNFRHVHLKDKAIEEMPSSRPMVAQSPDDLAYVIFTSGSTGTPKGVMIDHKGAVNTILDINRRFEVSDKDSILSLSALSFDLSVYDIFGLLAAGGSIVIPDARWQRDPRHWLESMRQFRVTIWNSAPALMEILADDTLKTKGTFPASLRMVMMSGDWIPVTLTGKIKSLMCAGKIISLGGATEASIWSILYPIETVDSEWKSIPYGKPMKNQNVFVLDDNLAPCPDWVPGHLYIGGIGLARGYLKDEQKTAASFIIHPKTGERLYKTGDIGRFLPDGNIEFLGREDYQVKIRGYRIELGEIENTLLSHPMVKNAVVNPVGENKNYKTLKAYVILNQKTVALSTVTSTLKTYLNSILPNYMIPSDFIFLDEFFLTSNGKIDRKLLTDVENAKVMDNFTKPRTDVELVLSELWKEITESEIGVLTDFYELGFDSLQAVRLNVQIRDVFQIAVPLRKMFELPTIEKLAHYIEANEETPGIGKKCAALYRQLNQMSEKDLEDQIRIRERGRR